MNLIFFGTPHFAAVVLDSLIRNGENIVAVVTQPDRKKGRSQKMAPSAVKALLLEKGLEIPILQPESAKDERFIDTLKRFDPDLFIVVAYGQILPKRLLDVPKLGAINVHASLLPKYRGAAPMQRALMNGEKETGIAIQKMVLKMDAGDIIATSKLPIPTDMSLEDLENALLELTPPLLIEVIREYEKGTPKAHAQDHEKATYAGKIEAEDCQIDWNRTNLEIHNQIRGVSPRPGAWCWIEVAGEKKRLKILKTRVSVDSASPGELLASGKVGCAVGSLQLLLVQPEGKKVMHASDWLRGQKNIKFVSYN